MLKKALYFFLTFFLLLNVIIGFQAYRSSYFYEQNSVDYVRPNDRKGLSKWASIFLGVKTPKRPLEDSPKGDFKTIVLTDSDGYKLEGWYISVPNPKGTVLLFHGHSSNKSKVLCQAEIFQSLGYNTLSMDARSHGNSEGNVSTVGYNEAEQVKLAHSYASKNGETNIIYWGASMGASTILRAIDLYRLKPNKIILNCPFASMHDAVKGFLRNMHLPSEPLASGLMFWGAVLRTSNTFAYNPAEYAKKLTMPVLLQWGTQDNRVTKEETDLIFKNIGSSDKKLQLFEESGHASYCNTEHEKWVKGISDFLAD